MVGPKDLKLLALLDLVVVGTTLAFYNRFLAVCYDEEFARVRGVSTGFYYVLLLCLTALTVVALTSVVGIVIVITSYSIHYTKLYDLPLRLLDRLCSVPEYHRR